MFVVSCGTQELLSGRLSRAQVQVSESCDGLQEYLASESNHGLWQMMQCLMMRGAPFCHMSAA